MVNIEIYIIYVNYSEMVIYREIHVNSCNDYEIVWDAVESNPSSIKLHVQI